MSCSVANLIDHNILTKVVILDHDEYFFIPSDGWKIYIGENALFDFTLLDDDVVKITRGDEDQADIVEFDVYIDQELDIDLYKYADFEF